MSIQCKFASHAEADKNNWFSRRHRDSEAHRAAQQLRRDHKAAQFQALQERLKRQEKAA